MERRLVLNDKTISWFLAFVVVSNVTVFTLHLEVLYYAFLFITLIVAINKSKITAINIPMLLLYIACALSIIMNSVPSFFKPWERLFIFIVITAILSPFIESTFLKRFRIRIFQYTQWLMQLIVIISFILYLLGISVSDRKDFSGITNQSMLLAPIAANVAIGAIYYITHGKKSKKLFTFYSIGLLIAALLVLLLTASRSALLATLLAITAYLFIVYHSKLHYLIKLLGIAIFFAGISFSYWSPYLNNLNKKNQGSMTAGGITSSRDILWETRLSEFESSPFWGIGFASVSITQNGGSTFNLEDGKVETGSSWLAILSMTGIVGLGCFLIIWLRSISMLYQVFKINVKYASYLFALIIFWSLHLVAEGYIYAAGSFLFFLVWLLIGYINTVYNHPKYIHILNNTF